LFLIRVLIQPRRETHEETTPSGIESRRGRITGKHLLSVFPWKYPI
jgi:hypothetical protein